MRTHKISGKKCPKKEILMDYVIGHVTSKKGNNFQKKVNLMAYISNSKNIFHFEFPFLETISFFGITIKGNYIFKKSEKYQKNPKKY